MWFSFNSKAVLDSSSLYRSIYFWGHDPNLKKTFPIEQLNLTWNKHSYTKRNSLGIWTVFIQFLEYANNGGVVVYWGGRYFNMSSKTFRLAMTLEEFWYS